MTTTKTTYHDVVVVDGSNIATEGRSMPSLAQLNEAVMAFREEFPDATITVVVDATFGHRIDKSEVKQFDDAVAHNELVAPPAGAIGRGDAFVLTIANKVGARILSNDSFQEFHGEYPWLFDEGRLIGGKPVPFVGWVFVERLPVKGPASRKSTRAARSPKDAKAVRRTASKEASLPMPVPTAPPPNSRSGRSQRGRGAPAEPAAVPADTLAETSSAAAKAPPAGGSPVNDLLPFLDFVERHPVGSSVNGVVESYSSHGAYVQIGDLRGYVPLRLMSDPPPRSAREVMKVGDAVTLVVTSFAAARRSVDLAVPEAVPAAELQATPELAVIADAVEAASTVEEAPAKRPRRGRKAAAEAAEAAVAAATEAAAAELLAAEEPAGEPAAAPAAEPVAAAPAKRGRRTAAKKVAAGTLPAAEVDAAETVAEPAPAKKAAAKKAAAKKTAAKKPAAKKAAPKKAAATKQAAARPATADEAPAPGAEADEAVAPDAAAAPTKRPPAKKRAAPKRAAPSASTIDAPSGPDGDAPAGDATAAEPAPAEAAPAKKRAAPRRAARSRAGSRSEAEADVPVSAAARRRRSAKAVEATEG